jgi:DNA (cytosine-5)-methyltransferase 1
MKVIDLFSGIGGFSLGLEGTGGFETVQFVENNKWCQKVLAKNFPGVPITGDIRNYEGQEQADVVTGGFPCQPFSVAGKRKGTEDDRHLWPEMLRVIKSVKPKYIIGENVRNITSIQEGMVFEQVCTDLENEGYEVQSFIIPASAVNAPHQRYRVWIVGYSKHNGSQDRCKEARGEKRESEQGRMLESERTSTQQNVADTQCDGLTSTKKRGSIEETIRQESQGENRTLDSQGASGLSETKQDVADSEISDRYAHETDREHGETTSQEVFRNRSGIHRQTSWWSSEPNVGRVAHGVSDRVDRLKGLGNAIVPQIAYQIGLAILEAENEHTKVD